MGIQIGHLTDRGRVREINEDSYLALTAPNLPPNVSLLLAVADGMGGHQAGNVASGQVVATLDHLFSTGQFQQLVDYNPTRSDYYAAALKDVIEAINENLVDMADKPGLKGMGTTATVGLLCGNQLFVGHVGDSRAYILRGGLLQQITQDHSWVADQVASGALTADEAYHHPQKNLLLRALGHNLSLRVDRSIQDVYAGDAIILCSDGLTNKITNLELAQIVAAQPNPQLACQQLVQTANRRGGEDNITVLIVRLNQNPNGANALPGGRVFGPQTQKVALSPQAQANTDQIAQQVAARQIAPKPGVTQVYAAPGHSKKSRPKKQTPSQRFDINDLLLFLAALVIMHVGLTVALYIALPTLFGMSGTRLLSWLLALPTAASVGFMLGIGFVLTTWRIFQ